MLLRFIYLPFINVSIAISDDPMSVKIPEPFTFNYFPTCKCIKTSPNSNSTFVAPFENVPIFVEHGRILAHDNIVQPFALKKISIEIVNQTFSIFSIITPLSFKNIARFKYVLAFTMTKVVRELSFISLWFMEVYLFAMPRSLIFAPVALILITIFLLLYAKTLANSSLK